LSARPELHGEFGIPQVRESDSVSPAAGELERALAAGAAYCRKLSAAVLDFVCEERIAEEIYEYFGEASLDFSYASLKKRTEKNDYLYDYQMIRTPAGLREDRTLLEENGRTTRQPHARLKTKRFFSYQSIYGPIGFFAGDRQPLFDYALGGRSTMNGIPVRIVEVKPKSGRTDLPSGKAWIDLDSGRILKIERDAESLEGYGAVVRSYDADALTPRFVTEHFYETEKNGILFPSKTVFRESFRTKAGRRFQAGRIEITFANYRFFTVQTEERIIKTGRSIHE
jgi:hypothetical protein